MVQTTLPLIPAPQNWQPTAGFFLKKDLDASPLVQHLESPENLPLPADEIIEPGLMDESYKLVIQSSGLELSAKAAAGSFVVPGQCSSFWMPKETASRVV